MHLELDPGVMLGQAGEERAELGGATVEVATSTQRRLSAAASASEAVMPSAAASDAAATP